MTVAVNTVRKAVEISWDPDGPAPVEPPVDERPPGMPVHPIHRPDHHPDQSPPVGETPPTDPDAHPEHPIEMPGQEPHPEHPIYWPPHVEHPIVLPPELPDELPPDLLPDLPPEAWEKIKDFLLGNLPPYDGAPNYPAPVSDGEEHKTLAVQIFAQGQDGDWSNTAIMRNDGLAVLTYPENFSGESYVEVRDLCGHLVDSGTIVVESD